MYAARSFAASQKTYCIQMGNKHVCAYDVLSTKEVPYALGFASPTIARNIMHGMSPNPKDKVMVKRSWSIDVAKDVNNGLDDLKVHPEFRLGELLLDMDASIIIKKVDSKVEGDNSDVSDHGFYISTVDTADFLAYPFDYSIGIALPLFIHEEDESQYILKSVIVEPSYCAPRKIANLKKMMDQ